MHKMKKEKEHFHNPSKLRFGLFAQSIISKQASFKRKININDLFTEKINKKEKNN